MEGVGDLDAQNYLARGKAETTETGSDLLFTND